MTQPIEYNSSLEEKYSIRRQLYWVTVHYTNLDNPLLGPNLGHFTPQQDTTFT